MGRLSRVTSPLTIFTIATVVGVLTGLQAYNYVALDRGAQAAVQRPARAQPHLLVVVGAARSGRAVDGAPLSVRAATRGRRAASRSTSWRCRRVHRRTRCAGDIGSRRDHDAAHRASLRLVDVLPRALLPEFRLGDDDVLGARRPSSTRSTTTASRRSARSRARNCRHSWPRRSSRRCSASCIRTSCSTR